MDPILTKARDRVIVAEQALDAALAAGTDTTEAREALQLAVDEVDRVGAELARQQTEDVAAFLAEIEQAGAEMATQTATEINAHLAALATIPAPTVVLDSGMAARAVKVEREAAAAAAEAKAHRDRIADLKQRLASLEAERAATGAARKPNGRWDDEAGRKLALLAADVEGVTRLIASEERAAPAPAGTGYNHGAEWRESINGAKSAALLELARTLEARLLEVATEARACAVNGDLRGRWIPSPQLARVVAMGVV
ncbi:MAG: hypothetical protein EOM91_16705 [Sphingobacteriia bacterium]|nr:hypothetical protein [Sphingobacteriia bacterium]